MTKIFEEEKVRYRLMASKAMVHVARDLRERQTSAEVILWECLRNRRLGGLKFRRQHPIAQSNYVADFFNYESHLVIELDGGIHEHQQAADAERQRDIEALSYRVIRFGNEQVFSNLEDTLIVILRSAAAQTPPSP